MTTPRRLPTDANSAAATFSYAQAAKGMSSSASVPASATISGGNSSKPASGTITPAKDISQIGGSLTNGPSGVNWADDAEPRPAAVAKVAEKPSAAERDSLSNGAPTPAKSTLTQQPNVTSVVSSPDLGAVSSSTLGKDDDVLSIHNASSESTWENKSQTSNTADKTKEKNDLMQEKTNSKDAEKEKPHARALQDAPIPTVNIWKMRAEEAAKARASFTPVTKKASTVDSATGTAPAKSGGVASIENSRNTHMPPPGKGGKPNGADGRRSKDEDLPTQPRRDAQLDREPRKRTVGRGKDDKSVPAAPLPPTRDQEAWPTPESAQDEEKRRTLEKGEKERGTTSAGRPHGKSEWVQIPYTPSVVFNTPMPNAGSRRGGRGGGRGGSQASGRGNAYAGGAINHANAGDAPLPNGDALKRGKGDANARRELSPKSRAAANAGNGAWKDAKSANATVADRATKFTQDDESKRAASEDIVQGHMPSQVSNASRPLTGARQKPNRKPEGGIPDRRRENEVMSPTRESNYHRRVSPAAHAEESDPSDKKPGHAADSQGPLKAAPAERRSGPFGGYAGRDREPRGRGSMRGRGGHGSYAHSSHPNGQPYTNGNGSVQSPSTYNLPKSPSSFYQEQPGGGYFTSPPRGFGRNGSRPQSVSTDPMYGRAQSSFPPGSQNLPPLQTFINGPLDYQMMQPISAVPWTPYFAQDQLFTVVTSQIEYYFSIENLCKDVFLRKHMDSQGFVYLKVITDFNRVKQLTTDLDIIKLACYHSREIEYRVGADGQDRLRRREGWEPWVLPTGDRDASVQNDGPEDLHHPPVPHPQGFTPGFDPYMMRYPMGPVSGSGSPGGPHPEASFTALNGMGLNGPVPNGPAGENPAYPHPTIVSGPMFQGPHSGLQGNIEGDAFSNEQVETLTVVSRKQDPSQVTGSLPLDSRTFSNGSIDSRNMTEEFPSLEARRNGSQLNGHPPAQGEEGPSSPDLKSALSLETKDPNRSQTTPLRLFWVKDKETPVEKLPADSTCELYVHLRSKALEQRDAAVSGVCPYDMDVLYQFWSHFLIRNFNTRMYDEFRHLAFEDARRRMSDTGMKNLIKYYGEALTSQSIIRQRVARHYIRFVHAEDPNGERIAFKQLGAAWKNSALNVKNRKTIADYIDHDLLTAFED